MAALEVSDADPGRDTTGASVNYDKSFARFTPAREENETGAGCSDNVSLV